MANTADSKSAGAILGGSSPSIPTIYCSLKIKLNWQTLLMVDILLIISMKPYVYKITSKNNEYYFGVRWDYKSTPQEDLWKEYFTSSTLVHELIQKNGKEYFYIEILFLFESKEDALNK